MNIFLMIIIGVVGGILGGAGMGGGTLLLPLITTFLPISQHVAQSINLIAFIPMSIVVLVMLIRGGYVKYSYLLFISLPALLIAILSSRLAGILPEEILKKSFGAFLLILGFCQILLQIYKNRQKGGTSSRNIKRSGDKPQKNSKEY